MRGKVAPVLGLVCLLTACKMDVLNPQGPVGNREASLLAISSLAMLIVVLPVIVLTFLFARRFRASNRKAVYDPKFSYSRPVEAAVWLVPCMIVGFLIVLNWRSTIALDPYRPLPSNVPTLKVEVVALDWKWLFIYPAQHVASVNQLVFPVGTQISFDITSDTVMNVFFIPQLGTQIYAMTGMDTQLHLIAKNPGSYRGLSANFSGPGFADMRFQAKAVSNTAFDAWVKGAQAAPVALNRAAFDDLAGASTVKQAIYFRAVDPQLFQQIIMAHNGPGPVSPQATE